MRDRGRGQLILVGGITLAVVLVGLVLLVNSAIYTDNLATRPGPDSGEPVGLRGDVDAAAGQSIAQLNAANTDNRSHGTLAADLEAQIGGWSGMLETDYAGNGRSMRLSQTGHRPGWRVLQTNSSRNFTAGGTDGLAGDGNWTVAEDVPETAVFEQNVSRTSLFGATYSTTKAALADSSYHIAIDEPGTSGFWRVYIFEGAGTQQVYVVTEEPDQDFQGSTSAHINWATDGCSFQTLEWAEVDVRGATLGGAPCDELQFFADLEPGYDIYYNNTVATVNMTQIDRSQGTYELFVADATVDKEPYYPASADESPFTLTALYSADYEVTYEGGDVEYWEPMTVEPDRSTGIANRLPTGSFSYDDQTGKYVVDWSATDDEGSLEKVELLLYENGTKTKIDGENVSVSGGSASGTVELDPTSSGVKYDIYMITTDTGGASTVEKETDVAD